VSFKRRPGIQLSIDNLAWTLERLVLAKRRLAIEIWLARANKHPREQTIQSGSIAKQNGQVSNILSKIFG
jgi:hypothetical protein